MAEKSTAFPFFEGKTQSEGIKYLARKESENALRHKVFCVYHRDDEAAFRSVAAQMLSAFDCAILYAEEKAEGEALTFALDSVGALILLVSSRYLFAESEALYFPFSYAKSHNIPVLPILIEEGLEEVVNERLGNLQCLSPLFERVDATVLPFEEKLKKYFSAIFAAGVDKARLKESFSASIFLSYRKRDRYAARRLIELIHASPDCRGIALWYDEFLVPGEDFNEGIKAELEESTLFVLAITPFAADGNNYIKLTEYPMASALGKPILPFEVEKTEESALAAAFPSMPSPVPAPDTERVRAAILAALQAAGVSLLESTEEKRFLMGLAYLSGVCVEKNYAYAVELIEGAASSGVPAAIERLAEMYTVGEAVSQSYPTAASLWRRLLAICEKAYKSKKTKENGEEVLRVSFALAECLVQGGETEAAVEAYRAIIFFIGEEAAWRASLALAFELAGKLLLQTGAFMEARLVYLDKALEIRKALYEEEKTALSLLNCADVYVRIATCCEQCEQVVGVKQQIVLLRNLLGETSAEDCFAQGGAPLLKRLISVHNALGHMLNYMLPLNAAGTWNIWDMTARCVGNTRLLAQKLVGYAESRDAQKELYRALCNEGDFHAPSKVENHQRAALESYLRAEAVLQEYADGREDSLEYLSESAALLARKGAVYLALKETDSALAAYKEAALRYRTAQSLAAPISLCVAFYTCLTRAGEAYLAAGDRKTAEAFFNEALAQNEAVLERSPQPAFRFDIAVTLGALASIYKKAWDVDTAAAYLLRGHGEIKAAAYAMGRRIDFMRLAESYRALISLYKLSGEFGEVKRLSGELDALVAQNGLE